MSSNLSFTSNIRNFIPQKKFCNFLTDKQITVKVHSHGVDTLFFCAQMIPCFWSQIVFGISYYNLHLKIAY
jgi:hypothetical protein